MKKKILLIIFILVALMIIFVTGAIWFGKSRERKTFPWSPRVEQVTITTDKIEFKQGEIVKIVVRNDSGRSIWYLEKTCPPFCVSLQKLENDQWIDAHMAIKVISDLPVRPSSLELNKEISREWDMFVVKPVDQIITAEGGNYRFSFYYGLSKDSYTEKTIYSDQFIIKERGEISIITIITDKREYFPSEKIKINIVNNLREEINGTIRIERYIERKEKWEEIEIGTLEVERQFKDFIKSYGPVASIEKLSKGYNLRISWVPVTQEPMGVTGESVFGTVALGKNRIKLVVQEEGKEEVFYSNEFLVGEK